MSYMDTYRANLERRGHTLRDRRVNIARNDIIKLTPDHPSYKPVVIKGVETHAVVLSKDDFFIKEVVCMPGEYIPFGHVIEMLNDKWISMKRDFDDEIYSRSIVYMCNMVLRWIDKEGEYHEYDCWVEDATKYSSGETSVALMRTGDFHLKARVTLDDYTCLIDRDWRFMIDTDVYKQTMLDNDRFPQTYRVTRRNVVTNTRDDEGYIELTLLEDQVVKGKDNFELMVAAQPWELVEPYPDKENEEPEDSTHEEEWL